MRRFEINGRRGFILYDACWSLLEEAFHPTPVPHVRLFEICNSLPLVMAGDSINWGHDHGGLAIIRDKHFFPWVCRPGVPRGVVRHSVQCRSPCCLRSRQDSGRNPASAPRESIIVYRLCLIIRKRPIQLASHAVMFSCRRVSADAGCPKRSACIEVVLARVLQPAVLGIPVQGKPRSLVVVRSWGIQGR